MPHRRPWLVLLLLLVLAPWSSVFAADPKPDDPKPDDPKPAENEPAPTAPETDTPKPTPEAAKARAEEQARIQKTVNDLMPIVARLRGLEWKKPVPAAVMSRKELRAFMIKEMAKEVTPEEWARDTRIMRRLGLLGADEDLLEMTLTMFGSAVAGFYNPDDGNMVVVEGMDIEGQKPTIAHELIHALEDQHFDFNAIEEPFRDNDPDRVFAIRCMMEGSAEYGRRLFQDAAPAVAKHYYTSQAKNPGADAQRAMMASTPAYMLLTTLLHYQIGPNFVGHQVAKFGYVDGMQRLIDDQPTTQEHVLHPHKWLGSKRDYPRTVCWGGDLAAALGAPWKKIDEHSVGELDLALYLDYFLGDKKGRLNPKDMGFGKFLDDRSGSAARGWDAGRTMFLERDGAPMMVVQAFAFDTNEDAEEAARLLGVARRQAAGESWKGQGWVKTEDGVPQMGFDYTTHYGRGRILLRGQDVLVLDGVAEALFDKAWAVVAKTTFTKNEADQGDEAKDPFKGYDLIDRRRGLALKLPEGWTGALGGQNPAAFATVRKGQVNLTYIVIRQEVSQAGVPAIGRMLLGPMFAETKATPTQVMGAQGLQHPLPTPSHVHGVMHFASDLTRTYVVMVAGPKAEVAAAAEDIQRLLDGMPGPLAEKPATGASNPDLEGSAPPAGLRSIPGY